MYLRGWGEWYDLDEIIELKCLIWIIDLTLSYIQLNCSKPQPGISGELEHLPRTKSRGNPERIF